MDVNVEMIHKGEERSAEEEIVNKQLQNNKNNRNNINYDSRH